MTSLSINGGAIYDWLFLNLTKHVKTEGGNILDITKADNEGSKLLLEYLWNNSYDTYFMHLSGIDHAGHNNAKKN